MNISYAVLSGGKAKRFGSDKTKALYQEKPLYLYCLETGLSVSSDVMHISKDAEKYMNSPEFKAEMKKIRKSRRMRKRKKFYSALKSNAFDIINALIALAALIIAVLSYLK